MFVFFQEDYEYICITMCVNTYIWRRTHTQVLAAMQTKWLNLRAHIQRPSKVDTRRDTLKVKAVHAP